MGSATAAASKSSTLSFHLSFGTVSWLVLWAGINTGPENLRLDYILQSWTGAFMGIRAAFPLATLTIAGLYLLACNPVSLRRFTVPEILWIYYALATLASSTYADPWFETAYWGFAYLAVFTATKVFMQEDPDPALRAIRLNWLSWLVAALILVTILLAARGKLLAPGPTGLTGYGLINRMPTMAGMPTSRASGMSRFAAVPAIVALACLWQARGFARLLWAAILVSAFSVVWLMQSRGSLFSLGPATAIVMLVLGGRDLRLGAITLTLLVLVYLLGFISGDTIHHLYLYALRGGEGDLREMTGRLYIFHYSIDAIGRAPFVGYGWAADRRILALNDQNGFLYALLCGGMLGGSGYIAGLIVAWWTLTRLMPHRSKLTRVQLLTLAQAAGVLTFFTMRSYPENSAALYNVDLMLLLPAVVYIGELERALKFSCHRGSVLPMQNEQIEYPASF